eukprot:gnl/TRDRNA2_/TRDRNA2_41113_c0_seq1.p1 gnl/TRDRNA2_/TRDRNA2_41113_c0~~gnl/TRDRNA2_/TRDRNA2_41113_c0_seq1.p1  ORF type:complete len:397 (-),score=86.27 gnl/TRDRNA2_/TRDRNA2_41113_c0_seq1:49-1239(-)
MAANTGANTAQKPLRFGVLGAADINQNAIINPCNRCPNDAVIAALAARSRSRAETYVKEKKLASCVVYDSYQELLDRADVDAIYIPTPNGLHFEWTMKALEAGKHVLCEKPFSSNAEEARLMVAKAAEKGLVLMEAAHWFYHPFRQKLQTVIASGLLGDIEHVYGNFYFPGKPGGTPKETDKIRFDAGLAGGCCMDCGWYALNVVRVLMGRQVPSVEWAQAQKWKHNPEIDEGMKARLRFPSGATGEILCSYAGDGSDGFVAKTAPGSSGPPTPGVKQKHPLGPMRWDAEVRGSKATMACVNYGVPHAGNRVIVTSTTGQELLNEKVDSGGFSTYDIMVLAFCSHVRQVEAGWVTNPAAFENTGDEPVKQMAVIDAIYAKAGLKPRTGPARISAKL